MKKNSRRQPSLKKRGLITFYRIDGHQNFLSSLQHVVVMWKFFNVYLKISTTLRQKHFPRNFFNWLKNGRRVRSIHNTSHLHKINGISCGIWGKSSHFLRNFSKKKRKKNPFQNAFYDLLKYSGTLKFLEGSFPQTQTMALQVSLQINCNCHLRLLTHCLFK